MIELELSDIALLYKTVVVLPQDKTTKAAIETTTTVNADVPQLVKAERANHIVEPETPKKNWLE